MGEKCYYCDSTDTHYCTLCQHWFCDKCRTNYPKRIVSMIKERFRKEGKEWLTAEEYEERKEDELTQRELKAVKKAGEDYKAGRVLTTKELTKKLGLDEEEEK